MQSLLTGAINTRAVGKMCNVSTTTPFSQPRNATTPMSSPHLLATPNSSGKLSINFYTANHRHPYLPLPQVSHSPTTLLLSSIFTDKISKLRLSVDSNHITSSPHSPFPSTTPPDFSTFNPACESEIHQVLSNCPNISSPIPIPSPPGFSKNVHLSWSPQSVILSIFHSLPVSSTPFSKNLLSLHSSRNPP